MNRLWRLLRRANRWLTTAWLERFSGWCWGPMSTRMTFKVFEGPNLVAPFAAIVAELENPIVKTLSSTDISHLQDKLFPSLRQLSVALAKDGTDFPNLVAALTNAWRERLWLNALPSLVTRSDETQIRIAVGFYDLAETKNVLLIAIEMAKAIFARASGAAVDIQEVSQKIQRFVSEIRGRPVSKFTRALSQLAGARRIPVYPLCQPRGIYKCGQGAEGFQFWDTVNQQDTLTGWWLSENKAVTAHFLRRLGFPTVEHQIAPDATAASRIAEKLGFPVVVKPADQNYGTAVTVGVSSDQELQAAFERARAVSPNGQILVERTVPGDDHRLTVFAGELLEASLLSPAQIVGDGKRSVVELIDADNRARKNDVIAITYCPQLTIDSDMIALLHKQGFALEDRPPQGRKLLLRATSNLHTGGSFEDMAALIHPDNIAMAEAVARNFHLDAIGIDFITPDISKPWHEVECAIIEVNANPGITDGTLVEKYLLAKIPPGSNGCIPTILVVGDATKIADGVVQYIQTRGRRLGYTSSHWTQLAGQRRIQGTADLSARILSLLLDSTCEALVVSCTPSDIAEHGLPYTSYELALIATKDPLDAELRQLISDNSSQVVDQVTMEKLAEDVFPLLATIVSEI